MPDWTINLAHWSQGIRVTYIVQPVTFAHLALTIALSSAWHTEKKVYF